MTTYLSSYLRIKRGIFETLGVWGSSSPYAGPNSTGLVFSDLGQDVKFEVPDFSRLYCTRWRHEYGISFSPWADCLHYNYLKGESADWAACQFFKFFFGSFVFMGKVKVQ